MPVPVINVGNWVQVGEANRVHLVLDIDAGKALWTKCGIYVSMSVLHRQGVAVSASRPSDEDSFCRRCRR
jgi:hypothetical protein